MFRMKTSKNSDGSQTVEYSGTFELYIDEMLGKKLKAEIQDKLVEAYINKHGEELIDQINSSDIIVEAKREMARKLFSRD